MRLRATALLCALGFLAACGPAGADSEAVIGPDPRLVAGAEALQRGRFAEGLAMTRDGLRNVVDADQRAAALNNLCAGYTGLRYFDIAIIYCTESLEIAADRWPAYNNRALAYLGKGMLNLARRDVLRGLELNPDADRLREVLTLVDEADRRRPTGPERDPSA